MLLIRLELILKSLLEISQYIHLANAKDEVLSHASCFNRSLLNRHVPDLCASQR